MIKKYIFDYIKKSNFIQSLYWELKGAIFYVSATPSKVPWMTEAEKKLFYEAISDSNVILEFGSGGSTVYALEQGKKVFSIESSKWFVRLMKKSPIIQNALKKGNLLYHQVQMGTTKECSVPLNSERGELYWKKSIETISSTSTPIVIDYWDKIDTIFIDGRYRVACALNALINFPNVNKFIIHDYTNRPQYHILEKFFIHKKGADTLAILSPPANINIKEIKYQLTIYTNIYN